MENQQSQQEISLEQMIDLAMSRKYWFHFPPRLYDCPKFSSDCGEHLSLIIAAGYKSYSIRLVPGQSILHESIIKYQGKEGSIVYNKLRRVFNVIAERYFKRQKEEEESWRKELLKRAKKLVRKKVKITN